ncbi:PepSY domain-containing protein [Bordetella sp. LUAb4]|uniref:PepSY-associated TM helix domain-containing protein n=1 Tax=Bordetella sp. LUAb4 TaxID=2843195 RepID=UPI001E3F4EC7|nr:PepSY-associated TM helix domain-containing protein [Bordetella sp. LUAb4]
MRKLWLLCHRWTALTVGWVLILSGLTGATLVVLRPLDQWLHPELFVARGGEALVPAPATPSVTLESMRETLAGEFGGQSNFSFRPPRQPGETLQVLVRGDWRGTVYFDPASGAEQGRRGENEGVVALLYGLHSALWLQQTGKAMLACVAAIYVLLMVTGLVLWWPRKWPPMLRIEWRKGLLRALFDLHRSAGAVLALALCMSIATGAYLAWRPIGGWITAVSGVQRVLAPKLPTLPKSAKAGQGASLSSTQSPAEFTTAGRGESPRVPLDVLAANARSAFPDGRIDLFLYTAHSDRPLAVRMHVPDDPHPNGRSTVWLDPRDGALLAKVRWNDLDPGTRINSIVYPLHTGELGGMPLQATVASLGLALATLGITGLWLWWRRRAVRRRP